MKPIFITGIGTGVGKTLVAAIVAEALQADYWKPVQAGYADGTDSEWAKELLRRVDSSDVSGLRVHPEVYRLAMAASPHIAAREEGVVIGLEKILAALPMSSVSRPLVIEGAGGLLVPLNDREFVLDLIRTLDATVILVSRNYLGSINHSLLTAAIGKAHGLRVAGWIFNDQYLHYELEIVGWTGIPAIGSIPRAELTDRAFIVEQAARLAAPLRAALGQSGVDANFLP